MDNYVIKCGFCGGEIKINELEIDLPFIGKSLLISYVCTRCGYKTTDIELLEIKKPVRYTFKVKSSSDLYIKIVRSKFGKITLPEIDVEIIPGPIAEMFITNVEGLLERVRKHVEMAIRFNTEDSNAVEKGNKILNYIDEVIKGNKELTIIIEDPTGNSAILSEEAQVEYLSNDENNNL